MSPSPLPIRRNAAASECSAISRVEKSDLPLLLVTASCLSVVVGTGTALCILLSKATNTQERINFIPYFVIWLLLSVLFAAIPLIYVQNKKARRREQLFDVERHFYCAPVTRTTTTNYVDRRNSTHEQAFGVAVSPGPMSAMCRTQRGLRHVTLSGRAEENTQAGNARQRQETYPPLPPSGSAEYMDMILANYVGSGKPLPELPGPVNGEINPPRQSQIERNRKRVERFNGPQRWQDDDVNEHGEPRTPTKSSLSKPRIDSEFWRMISSIGGSKDTGQNKGNVEDKTPKKISSPPNEDSYVFKSGSSRSSTVPSTPTRRPRSMAQLVQHRPLRRTKRPMSVNGVPFDPKNGSPIPLSRFSGFASLHERKCSLQISDRPQRTSSLSCAIDRPLSAPLYRSPEADRVNFSIPRRSIRISPAKNLVERNGAPIEMRELGPHSPTNSTDKDSSSPATVTRVCSTPSSQHSHRRAGVETSSTADTSPSINLSLRVTRPGVPSLLGARMKPLPETPVDSGTGSVMEDDCRAGCHSPLSLGLCDKKGNRWEGCAPYEGT